MIITGKTFHTSTNTIIEHFTMLRFPDIVEKIDESDAVAFSTYQFNTTLLIDKWVKLFKKCGDKRIILDFSCELFSKELYDRLLIEENLSNIEIYISGIPDDIESLDPLINKGAQIIHIPFFLKYLNYYLPLKSGKKLDDRIFLLLVGKLKVERIALVGLLSYYELLSDGYVSFIRGKNNFSPEGMLDYFKTDSPEDQKNNVRIGLEKIKSDLVLDSRKLTHKISHTRKYNSDYYDHVDFVIVCESDANRNVNFITEKTGKCIQQNKKFILLGSKGLLSYIRQQAKLHLNKDISPLIDWCDTSYDEIDNTWERVDKIVEIVRNEINIRKTK